MKKYEKLIFGFTVGLFVFLLLIFYLTWLFSPEGGMKGDKLERLLVFLLVFLIPLILFCVPILLTEVTLDIRAKESERSLDQLIVAAGRVVDPRLYKKKRLFDAWQEMKDREGHNSESSIRLAASKFLNATAEELQLHVNDSSQKGIDGVRRDVLMLILQTLLGPQLLNIIDSSDILEIEERGNSLCYQIISKVEFSNIWRRDSKYLSFGLKDSKDANKYDIINCNGEKIGVIMKTDDRLVFELKIIKNKVGEFLTGILLLW